MPVALFLIPFAVGGGLGGALPGGGGPPAAPPDVCQLRHGAIPESVILTAPMLILLGCVLAARRALRGLVAVVVVGAALAATLVASRTSADLYQLAWRPAVFMLAFAVVAAGWLLRNVDESS